MADNCARCLLGAMDRLWFHQIILFSEPTSLALPCKCTADIMTPQAISETHSCLSSKNNSQSPLLEEEISPSSSAITFTSSEDLCNIQQDEEEEEKDTKKEKRPRSLNGLISSKHSRSRSSAWLNQVRYSKRLRSYYSGSVMRLQKTMSCKSLSELELEEVKGFMDLGFKFSREHMSPRMVSVLPGLQRLMGCDANASHEEAFRQTGGGHEVDGRDDDHEVINEGDEEEEGGVMRPYLSEAWVINSPDSPLLNFRVQRVSAASEMKKHLRCWARTVASVIQQES